ncbi:MAG: DUF423 domain-containing protein [Flavobacteriales bacterium]
MQKTISIIACVALALAVVAGAFGAHSLRNLLDEKQLATWQTAVLYQFIHALGALLLANTSVTSDKAQKLRSVAVWLLLSGLSLFSGSLYLLAVRELLGIGASWLGPLTPAGGVLFVGGWLLAAWSFVLAKRKER